MNYIKHINLWMEIVAVDDRLTANHISLYLALFQLWNKCRFPDQITIFRNEVLQVSKIGSSKTYYKCLHELNAYGYIKYKPSYNPMKGSSIIMTDLSDLNGQITQNHDEEHESTDQSESGQIDPGNEKKFLTLNGITQVEPGQNRLCSQGKIDTGAAQVVTPLYKNNINRLNNKQRARRAHAKENFNTRFFEDKPERGAKKISVENNTSTSNLRSEARLACSSKVPAGFSKPDLKEVIDFFTHRLVGNYLDKTLASVDRSQEAEKFFYHYESNGWRIAGKTPMKNWKTACRSWVAKIPYYSKPAAVTKNNNPLHVAYDGKYGQSL